MSENKQENTIQITLIHGTFARGARWTQKGSPLRNKLEDSFPYKVQFHDDFRWSGLPSHIARHVAAGRLQKYLDSVSRRNPGPHYLIAHSHGSLVSLYALRNQETAKNLDGIVSLSTPYLIARRRALSVLGWVAIVLSGIAALTIGLNISIVPFAWYLDSSEPALLGFALLVAGFAIQIGLIAAIFGFILVVDKLTCWFLQTMTIPELNQKRFLIVRGPSDEASALISLFHALELLVSAVWGRRGPFDRAVVATTIVMAQKIQECLQRTPSQLVWFGGIWLAIGFAIVLGAVAVAMWQGIQNRELFELWATSGWSLGSYKNGIGIFLKVAFFFAQNTFPVWLSVSFGALALPAIVVLGIITLIGGTAVMLGVFLGVAFLIAVVCTALLAIVSVPELGPCVATTVVSVEDSPPGRHSVFSGSDTSKADNFLTHSWSYSHPDALSAIAEFIAEPKPSSEPLIEANDPNRSIREQLRQRWDDS